MAVAFTEKEKLIIKNKLYDVTEKCLKSYGVRKTSVDELVKNVGISKGAFYLFYKSKEMLFFEVLENYQKKLVEELITNLIEKSEIKKEDLIDALFKMYINVKESFLITLIQNNEIEYLARKLPIEIIENHHSFDDVLMKKLFETIGIKENKNIEIISATLRAIFLTMLHEKEIGVYYKEALRIMITGVANIIYGGDTYDIN